MRYGVLYSFLTFSFNANFLLGESQFGGHSHFVLGGFPCVSQLKKKAPQYKSTGDQHYKHERSVFVPGKYWITTERCQLVHEWKLML